MCVNALASPIIGFAQALYGILNKFLLTLEAVKEKKEGSN
jgi:hypothetical protein